MKKFLLFLSCFLTTWCSVQAANPQITSATYNESSSTFSVSYTSNSSNNALMMVCKATGPVGSNVKLNASPATVDLPATARAGEYSLVLFSNGSPCYEKKNIIVTKYGNIKSFSGISTSSVTVNYNMFHAETASYPDKSYLKIVGVGTHKITNVKNGSLKWTGLKLTKGKTYKCEIYVDDKNFGYGTFKVPDDRYGHINNVYDISKNSVTVNYTMRNAETNNCYLKIVGVNNTTYKISNVNNGSYTWTGLNLAPGQYTCEMYVDGKPFDSRSFTVTSGDAVKLTPMGGNRLKIDFTLSSTGYVKFMVHTYTLGSSSGKGESKEVVYGQCDTYAGTYEVSVPYYSGYVGYAVELIKNGVKVNGNSVSAYNR